MRPVQLSARVGASKDVQALFDAVVVPEEFPCGLKHKFLLECVEWVEQLEHFCNFSKNKFIDINNKFHDNHHAERIRHDHHHENKNHEREERQILWQRWLVRHN